MMNVRAIVVAGVFALAGISAAPSAMAASFDGNWSLIAQTTNGHCGAHRFDVVIAGGQMYYPGGFFMGYPVGLGGAVSPSGGVRVRIVAGPRVGNATGRISRVRGGGTWAGTGPSGRCSGIWSAARLQGVPMAAPYPWFWVPNR